MVGIELATGKIVWRFPVEGYRADHMAISPDGARCSSRPPPRNVVHVIDTRDGRKTGEFASGDSPHENNYTPDGSRIFHASIGRVYTPSADRARPLGLEQGRALLPDQRRHSLALIKRWDMGQKLAEAGHPT